MEAFHYFSEPVSSVNEGKEDRRPGISPQQLIYKIVMPRMRKPNRKPEDISKEISPAPR